MPAKRTATAPPAKRSIRLFISYSHKDKVWMDRLIPLLDGFKYDDRFVKLGGHLDFVHAWHDRELPMGNPWDGEIKRELGVMNIFVPLVSAHFFSSWYVMNVELPAAADRFNKDKIKVVPILLYDMNLLAKCAFLHQFPSVPPDWWNKFPDPCEAHRAIDDALWNAIEGALTP